MPLAWNLLREAPWYRRDAFDRGLRAAGLDVRAGPPRGAPGDVLCIWNRYGMWHSEATKFEASGGTVLVAENGYLGAGGTSPKFDVHPGGPKPHHHYALARGWHNGRGRIAQGPMKRFPALGVEIKPWRTGGDHILVCPNRSFGVGEQVMAGDWAEQVMSRLRGKTSRPVRIRNHPGNNAPARPLEADLENAWAVIVWSSSVAVHSLLAGIPTFIEAPYHVMKAAAHGPTLDDVALPDRAPVFERMAWSQWTLSEIESGIPFNALVVR